MYVYLKRNAPGGAKYFNQQSTRDPGRWSASVPELTDRGLARNGRPRTAFAIAIDHRVTERAAMKRACMGGCVPDLVLRGPASRRKLYVVC